MLTHQVLRLPDSEVSEIGTRYPQSPAEMRAFLVKFFIRHYFQAQHSLFNYMTSNEFLNLLASGKLRILDIGCGPAVASLAITEMLVCILKYLRDAGEWQSGRVLKVTYALNDTSNICLATGQEMLNNYFRFGYRYNLFPIHSRIFTVESAFPRNMIQLRRISCNIGRYDIINFCYFAESYAEKAGFQKLVNGLLEIEKLCNLAGKILILIDQFNEMFTRRLAKALVTSSRKQLLTQYIYPKRGVGDTYTYTYYCCLYAPTREVTVKAS